MNSAYYLTSLHIHFGALNEKINPIVFLFCYYAYLFSLIIECKKSRNENWRTVHFLFVHLYIGGKNKIWTYYIFTTKQYFCNERLKNVFTFYVVINLKLFSYSIISNNSCEKRMPKNEKCVCIMYLAYP